MKQFFKQHFIFILFGGLLLFSVVTFANPSITLSSPSSPSQSPLTVVPVSGKVVDECGNPVENAMVSAGTDTVFTDINGGYILSNIPVGSNLTICVDYEPDPLDPYSKQVTVCDIIAVSKHILGIQQLAGPRRILCSDINMSGTISTIDLVEMRNYILEKFNILGVLPPQYFFLPAASINPAAGGFSGCLTLPNLQGPLTDIDFVRLAVGDADGSAAICTPVAPVPFKFLTSERTFSAGETFVVNLKAESPVNAFQFALQAQGLTIDSVWSAAPYNNPSYVNNGNLLKLAWTAGTGSLEQPTLQIRMTADSDGNLSSRLSIITAADQFPPVVSIAECIPVLPSLDFSTVGTGEVLAGDLRLINSPNPWRNSTTLEINTTTTTDAQLVLTDAAGKTILTKIVRLQEGNNVLTLNEAEVQVSGLLFFRVIASGAIWSGTMVKF